MSEYPETIRPSATVQEAAARMRAFDLGFLPVVQQERVVGVITDRDLVTRVLASELGAKRVAVEDIMSQAPVFCSPDSGLNAVMKTMAILKVRRILVVDGTRRLLGVIGLADLVRAGYRVAAARVLMLSSRRIPTVDPVKRLA